MSTLSRKLFCCLPLFVGFLLPAAACAKKAPPPPPAPPGLWLAETVPVETTLDNPAIPDAADTWVAMINGAQKTVQLGEFYVSSEPGSRLEAVIGALGAAKKRGVTVQLLVDGTFTGSNAPDLDRLVAMGVELRRIDLKKVTGGVLHAKYFIVDGREAWLGSQNFDWRSLTHVGELGLRFSEPAAVAALSAVFAQDWALAGGAPPPALTAVKDEPAAAAPPMAPVAFGADTVQVALVASPGELLPAGVSWDLPQLLRILDGATRTVRVQLLSYELVGYDKVYWDELDRALRRAASRGVKVELLVSNWAKKNPEIFQSLTVVRNIDVRFTNIPEASTGFVEYARVLHSKYIVVDGQQAWVGTSNVSRDYFHSSRNVGLLIEGAPFAAVLDQHFALSWGSAYAEEVDPKGSYTPPKRKNK